MSPFLFVLLFVKAVAHQNICHPSDGCIDESVLLQTAMAKMASEGHDAIKTNEKLKDNSVALTEVSYVDGSSEDDDDNENSKKKNDDDGSSKDGERESAAAGSVREIIKRLGLQRDAKNQAANHKQGSQSAEVLRHLENLAKSVDKMKADPNVITDPDKNATPLKTALEVLRKYVREAKQNLENAQTSAEHEITRRASELETDLKAYETALAAAETTETTEVSEKRTAHQTCRQNALTTTVDTPLCDDYRNYKKTGARDQPQDTAPDDQADKPFIPPDGTICQSIADGLMAKQGEGQDWEEYFHAVVKHFEGIRTTLKSKSTACQEEKAENIAKSTTSACDVKQTQFEAAMCLMREQFQAACGDRTQYEERRTTYSTWLTGENDSQQTLKTARSDEYAMLNKIECLIDRLETALEAHKINEFDHSFDDLDTCAAGKDNPISTAQNPVDEALPAEAKACSVPSVYPGSPTFVEVEYLNGDNGLPSAAVDPCTVER